jgi:hypothetical protein
MALNAWYHWLPRLALGVFALSLIFPLPRYLKGLEGGEYLVWLSQVGWVVQLALAMLLAGAVGIWWGRRRGREDRDP